jgi:GxxExxY protein
MVDEKLTYSINGGLFAVHKALGNIWKEHVYEKAAQLEFQARGLRAESQVEYDVFYFDKSVGRYRLDLLVEDQVIVELKAVPEILPIHQAQIISYLKGFHKPAGILANFGQRSLQHRTFANKLDQKTALRDDFDVDKIHPEGKDDIRELLIMANRILVVLGPGYFHQVYRRALYYELKQARVDFDVVKEVPAVYQGQRLDVKEVHFFIIGDLLVSVVAVRAVTEMILSRFHYYVRHFRMKCGLLLNFNALHLDFKYVMSSGGSTGIQG